MADVIGDLLCDWNRVWHMATQAERDDTRKLWPELLRLTADDNRWSKVRGILSVCFD